MSSFELLAKGISFQKATSLKTIDATELQLFLHEKIFCT